MTIALALAFAKGFLFVLAAMLPIPNPAATAPIFLTLTDGASPATRTLLARRVARNMFWLMAGSMLIGSYVLDFFGISLPIVGVDGGLILSSVAWRLLGATPTTPDSRAALAEAFAAGACYRAVCELLDGAMFLTGRGLTCPFSTLMMRRWLLHIPRIYVVK
jgi:multiple antibiotic resistance protein